MSNCFPAGGHSPACLPTVGGSCYPCRPFIGTPCRQLGGVTPPAIFPYIPLAILVPCALPCNRLNRILPRSVPRTNVSWLPVGWPALHVTQTSCCHWSPGNTCAALFSQSEMRAGWQSKQLCEVSKCKLKSTQPAALSTCMISQAFPSSRYLFSACRKVEFSGYLLSLCSICFSYN